MNKIATLKEMPVLVSKEIFMQQIEWARVIEQSELEALSYLRPATGDYFRNTGIKVNSIVKHWGIFRQQPGRDYRHPLQLDEAHDQYMAYLAEKKSYRQCDMQTMWEPVRCFVADRLLQIAFNDGRLASVRVRWEVNDILILRSMNDSLAQFCRKAHQYFIEQIRLGAIDMGQVAEQAVDQALSDVEEILIKKIIKRAQLALEANHESA